MSDENLVNSIAYFYGLKKEVIREYRGMDSRTAIERFLPLERVEELKNEGYLKDKSTESPESRLGKSMSLILRRLPELSDISSH